MLARLLVTVLFIGLGIPARADQAMDDIHAFDLRGVWGKDCNSPISQYNFRLWFGLYDPESRPIFGVQDTPETSFPWHVKSHIDHTQIAVDGKYLSFWETEPGVIRQFVWRKDNEDNPDLIFLSVNKMLSIIDGIDVRTGKPFGRLVRCITSPGLGRELGK